MTEPLTITICPPWCSLTHDPPGDFHADEGHMVAAGSVRAATRMFQDDQEGATPCIVVGGAGLTPQQAIAFASYLMDAAEVLLMEHSS